MHKPERFRMWFLDKRTAIILILKSPHFWGVVLLLALAIIGIVCTF